jgi:integrase
MGNTERGLPVPNAKLFYGDLRAALISNYVERGNRTLIVRADGEETIGGLKQLDDFCGYVAPKDGKPGSPGLPVARLTTDLARSFVRKRSGEDDSPGASMINHSLRCLRRMLHIAHEDGKIAVVSKIRLLKEPPARKGFLEQAKFDELLKALPSYLRPLILLLYWCGVRVGEALQIEWTQVDLKHNLIVLHEEQTKNAEPRTIPIPSPLAALLRDHEPKVGPVFDGTNLRTEWARACSAVGLGVMKEMTSEAGWVWHKYSGLKVHDLRRSAVRNLRVLGKVPEGVAMKISGHKTRAVFDRYNIVNAADVTAAMRAVELAALKAPAEQNAAPRVSAKLVQN